LGNVDKIHTTAAAGERLAVLATASPNIDYRGAIRDVTFEIAQRDCVLDRIVTIKAHRLVISVVFFSHQLVM